MASPTQTTRTRTGDEDTAAAATTSTSTTGTPSALQDEAPRDEEGLRTHYDVIVCGTGLVQSILASALSRAGLSVLHCDASDYYGELDAVWTLPYVQQKQTFVGSRRENGDEAAAAAATSLPEEELNKQKHDTILPLAPKGECQSLRIHSMKSKMEYPIEIGTLLSTPYGPGKVVQLPQSNNAAAANTAVSSSDTNSHCLVFELIQWKLADGCHPRVHVGIPSDILNSDETTTTTITTATSHETSSSMALYLQHHCSIEPVATTQARTILQERNRSLALDVTPALVYAAGTAVQALLTSGVADYLEWKSVEGLLLYYLDEDKNANDGNNNKKNKLERVPCHKNDVFSSKLLGPMDKRRLMKFLQLAMDYGIVLAEEENNKNNNKNETAQAVQSLNERKLNQGRSLARPQNKSVAANDMETLRASMDMPFVTYLQDKQRLSDKLIQLVRYALALESSSSSTLFGDGVDDCQNNMGMTVQEGMRGLTQHMASLGQFGTTAFLVPMYGSGELAQAFCRSAAVYGATYLLRRAPVGIVVNKDKNQVTGVLLSKNSSCADDDDSNEPTHDTPMKKQVSCSHVIVPSGAFADSSSSSPLRIRLVESRKRVLRRISILRGKPLGANVQNRHIVIYPPDTFGNEAVIYGLLLDETLNVTPHVPGGCTVVHLTTTTRIADRDEDRDDKTDMLQQALDQILSESTLNNDASAVDEIFHMTFSYAMTAQTSSSEESALPKGLHISQRPAAPELAADPAFEEAARIFHQLVGADAEFLAMSQAMTRAVEERIGEIAKEDDDERMALESAVNMISSSAPQEEEGHDSTTPCEDDESSQSKETSE